MTHRTQSPLLLYLELTGPNGRHPTLVQSQTRSIEKGWKETQYQCAPRKLTPNLSQLPQSTCECVRVSVVVPSLYCRYYPIYCFFQRVLLINILKTRNLQTDDVTMLLLHEV